MRLAFLVAFLFLARLAFAETAATNAAPSSSALPKTATSSGNGKSASSVKTSHATTAQLQTALDQLTQSNRDLLDLLKKQQTVLEDIQFDRRQQSRHIESLEERLSEAQLQNSQLQNKIATLEANAATRSSEAVAPTTTTKPSSVPNIAAPVPEAPTPTNSVAVAPEPPPPPPPATYLRPPESEGAPGTKSWHRLFTLKGIDGKKTDLFHIQGRTWRVLWHNQDPAAKNLKDTSGLFINAFPKDDTIPQKVCAKVGSGGDSAELVGPGNYYLKIDASGGSWELAVEDFQ